MRNNKSSNNNLKKIQSMNKRFIMTLIEIHYYIINFRIEEKIMNNICMMKLIH